MNKIKKCDNCGESIYFKHFSGCNVPFDAFTDQKHVCSISNRVSNSVESFMAMDKQSRKAVLSMFALPLGFVLAITLIPVLTLRFVVSILTWIL